MRRSSPSEVNTSISKIVVCVCNAKKCLMRLFFMTYNCSPFFPPSSITQRQELPVPHLTPLSALQPQPATSHQHFQTTPPCSFTRTARKALPTQMWAPHSICCLRKKLETPPWFAPASPRLPRLHPASRSPETPGRLLCRTR